MSKLFTGYNADTNKHFLLDAGAVFKNFTVGTDTYASARTANKLIGATQGGSEFTVKPDIRTIDIDGIKGKVKGGEILNSVEVSLVTNLLEVTADTVALALGSTTKNPTTGSGENITQLNADTTNYDMIVGNTDFALTDYIENITFVGTISGSDQPIIIQVFNALNTEGLSLKMEDQKEAVISCTFYGHIDLNDDGTIDSLPYAIYLPKIATT